MMKTPKFAAVCTDRDDDTDSDAKSKDIDKANKHIKEKRTNSASEQEHAVSKRRRVVGGMSSNSGLSAESSALENGRSKLSPPSIDSRSQEGRTLSINSHVSRQDFVDLHNFAQQLQILQREQNLARIGDSVRLSLAARAQLRQHQSSLHPHLPLPMLTSLQGSLSPQGLLGVENSRRMLANLAGIRMNLDQDSSPSIRTGGMTTQDPSLTFPSHFNLTGIDRQLSFQNDDSTLLASLVSQGRSNRGQLDWIARQVLATQASGAMGNRLGQGRFLNERSDSIQGLHVSHPSEINVTGATSALSKATTGIAGQPNLGEPKETLSSMTPAGIPHQDLYARETSADDNDQSGDGPRLVLYMQACDDDNLSAYQCLVRKQVELFEAKDEDIESNAQGRNKPIVPGQVGIRCRHCSRIPPRHRTRGASYYPAKLHGLYQAAQNMASAHLCHHCQLIPDALRRDLITLRDRKSSAGGGKRYWADCVRIQGVVEANGILRFDKGDTKGIEPAREEKDKDISEGG